VLGHDQFTPNAAFECRGASPAWITGLGSSTPGRSTEWFY
jgi:hypothetical protein